MGLKNFVQNLFRSRQKTGISILDQININKSYFTRTIYNIPEVRTAINTMAEIISTVPIWRKRIDNSTGEVDYLNDNLDYLLNFSPNPIQNKSQFWSYLITRLLLNNTVAIEIIYKDNEIDGLYPYPYHKIRKTDNARYFYFEDDIERLLRDRENTIILTRFSEFGNGTEEPATDLYEKIITSIQERAVANTKDGSRIVAAVKRSLMQHASRVIKSGDTKANMDVMSEQVESTTGAMKGFVYLDGATDIIPLTIPEIKIEKELLKIITEAVYNYYGISENIIKGIATEIEWQQCLMKFPKFFCNQSEQEFTRKIFSRNEIAHGNRIEFDYLSLQISTIAAKVALMNSGILNGYLNQDDCLELIGWPPLPNGLGKTYRGNLNTASLELIDKYQLSKANNNGGFVENAK